MEDLQPRLLLTDTTLNVSIVEGTLFVRDVSGGFDNDIRIRVWDDRLHVIDYGADVVALAGSRINSHKVEVPLSEITSRRVAVYGGSGDDQLSVFTRDGVSLAFAFSGDAGHDSWNVNGTAQDDVISIAEEQTPGSDISTFTKHTVDTGLSTAGDMVIDEAEELVFVSGPNENRVAVFDFEGRAVDQITGIARPWGMAIDDGLLYVAAYDSSTVEVFDVATREHVQSFTLSSPDSNPSSLVKLGNYLFVAVRNGHQSIISRIDVRDGASDSGVVNNRSFTYPLLRAASTDSNVFYAANTSVSPTTVFRIDVSSGDATVVSSSRDFGSNLRGLAVADGGETVFTASGSPYIVIEADAALERTQQYTTGNYPSSVAVSEADGGYVLGGILGIYSPDIFLFKRGKSEPLLSVDVGRARVAQTAIDSRATRAFAVTEVFSSYDVSHLHVLTLSGHAVAVDGETAVGLSASTEELVVNAGDGNDVINAKLSGGTSTDIYLNGEGGSDHIAGGPGDQTIVGGLDSDTLIG